MNFNVRLEINFHEQDRASALFETNAIKDERFAELLMFCCYTVRHLYNLSCGGDPGACAKTLAKFLTQMPEAHVPLMRSELPDTASLVEYPGQRGEKRFIGRLKITDKNLQFHMDLEGFDILGSGLGYYSPNPVLLLFQYLANGHFKDKDLDALINAAVGCGMAFQNDQISLTSQNQVALSVAATAFAEFAKDETLATLKTKTENENPILTPWEQLSKSDRKRVQLMIVSLKEFSFGFDTGERMSTEVEQGSAPMRFYLNSLYQYRCNYYLVGGAHKLMNILKKVGSGDLLEPVETLLATPLGETTFGEILRTYRDKFLTHQTFTLAPIQSGVYRKYNMLEPDKAKVFQMMANDLFFLTKQLFLNLNARFPEALYSTEDWNLEEFR
jgi:hypothetical protein